MTEQPDYDEQIDDLEAAIAEHQRIISRYRGRIAMLKALQYHGVSPSKASELPLVGNYPFGYSKGATGAMERRTAHVLHVSSGPDSESRAFWPDKTPLPPTWMTEAQPPQPVDDIRIDPPYDR